VKTTTGAASASRRRARVAASSRGAMRIVDTAMHPMPARAAARRTAACCPTGRREITYHPGGRRVAFARMSRSLWRAAPSRNRMFPMTHFPYEHLLPHLDAHYQGMPPVAAMQVSIAGFDGDCLRLDAPLDRNVNDKGCAFGGSLASLMTLAAWGVVTLRVQGAGMHADVFVADSQVRYLAPLYGDLRAEAEAAPESDWHAFLATLAERGRARTELVARVALPEGGDAATFRARFVAFRKG
jgi:thioesterase domain-containing protein